MGEENSIDSSQTPERCPRYEGCSAPLCPLEKMTLEQSRSRWWYWDEEICLRYVHLWWVKMQRRLRRAKQPGGFSIEMLATMKRLGNGIMSDKETVEGWMNRRK